MPEMEKWREKMNNLDYCELIILILHFTPHFSILNPPPSVKGGSFDYEPIIIYSGAQDFAKSITNCSDLIRNHSTSFRTPVLFSHQFFLFFFSFFFTLSSKNISQLSRRGAIQEMLISCPQNLKTIKIF